MNTAKRIFFIFGNNYNPLKNISQVRNAMNGFIRLGHDLFAFDFDGALREFSMFKSKTLSARFYKQKVDRVMIDQIKAYRPDIIYVAFPRALNADSIRQMRTSAPHAVFIGHDGDPWPKLNRDRVGTAKELDIMTATNDGQWLQDYREAGISLCKFLPNTCDPTVEYRYEVSEQWHTDILWTGKAKHHADSSENFRDRIVTKLSELNNCRLYGCFGRPKIGGIEYYYAISGTRIGVSVNAGNSVKFYHSDRLTNYLACGAFVLAKRVPDTDILFKDGEHLKYFDEIDEFFELASGYLKHEAERKKIADAGMNLVHNEFNCKKIAQCTLDLVEKGNYDAPWSQYCSV